MEIEQLQEQMNNIFAQYPWASEETAEKLAKLATRNSVKTTALAMAIQSLHGQAGADKLKATIADTVSDLKKSSAGTRARIQRAKGYADRIGNIGGGMSGLDAITELTAAGAEALSAGAGGIAGMASRFPAVSLAMKGTAWISGGIAATAGIAAVFSKLISQQEKELRTMIDLGLVLSDQDNYTQLRGSAIDLGMNLNDYAGVMAGTSAMLTGTGQTMAAGSGKLYKFLTNKEHVARVDTFGYSPKALSMAMADEANSLYKLNMINEFNDAEQERVVKSFETANKVGLYLAGTMGGRRQELMDARNLIRDNQDFKQGMLQNQDFYTEEYGEGAADNIRSFNETFAMMSGMVGEELGNELVEVMGRMANNIQYDESPINDMNTALIEKLNKLGPGVLEQFVSMATAGQTNKIKTPEVAISEMKQFISLIRQSPMLQGLDPDTLAVERIRATALTLEDSIFKGSPADIKANLDSMIDKVDGADDSIDIVGGMSKAFLEVQHLITPGFGSTGAVMKVLGDSVDGFASVWSSVFGLDNGLNPDTTSGVVQDFTKDAMLTTLMPNNVQLNSSGKIDTTTLLATDPVSNKEATQEVVARTHIINRSLAANWRKLMDEQTDVSYQIKKLGVEDLADTEEDLRAALESAKINGVDYEIAEATAKFNTAQNNHAIAKAAAEAKQIQLDEIQNAMEANRVEQQSNRESLQKVHTGNQSYVPGSTIEGIMIAELISQGITDVDAQANVLAMIYGESGFKAVSETSYKNTANQRIRDAFGGRISKGDPGDVGYMTDAQLTALKKDDKAFFDHVYKDIGGYKYRGRGFIQLTGEANYKEVGELIGVDLLNNPDLMLEPEIAARASAAYFNIDTKQRYKSGLNNTATAYHATYGVAATAANKRLNDLANRTQFANQYKESILSGELKASQSLPAAIAVLNNRIETIKADEARNGFHPGGENQANLRELADLEIQLAKEMVKLKDLEEARNG
jgi:predicted chitinase